MSRDARPQCGVRRSRSDATTEFFEGQPFGDSDVDAVEDGIAEYRGKKSRWTIFGRIHLGWFHPNASDLELVTPERGVDREDLATFTARVGARLGHMSAYDREYHLDVEVTARGCIGQVLRGGPHGRTARGLFHGDDCCAEPTPSEEEVAGSCQFRTDVEMPVHGLVHASDTEELF